LGRLRKIRHSLEEQKLEKAEERKMGIYKGLRLMKANYHQMLWLAFQ
jgi:hypothetical protein